MHQPVRWQEWGEEAFAAARRDNKPILLDIGAVWCHWCHVMDRESYDDAEIAKIVNENFIAVKVDRDERPDIDSRYQMAVNALTGQGGWPLTAFLTPDGKPFYGGTYFPPNDQYGRPSFQRVLLSIAQAYREKHSDVMEQTKLVESAIARSERNMKSEGNISPTLIEAIVESARKMFDEANGGFGHAPKFPHPSALDLVMHRYVSGTKNRPGSEGADKEDENLRHVFVHTLEKMARGGVYDQLAGGFHRYSVDERWTVPHFEKMSYDNSELLKNYIHAYQATGEEFFAEVARDIVRWMDAWLTDRAHGGFYSSQDADYSMDDDGDYFTWTLDETRAALDEEEARVAELHYDIGEIGEMHHNPAKNVLYVRATVEEIAPRLNLSEQRVRDLLQSAKKKMYEVRLKRPTPYVDKTVYVCWNAMCISAYLEAANVLELRDARAFALRSLDRLLAEGWRTESQAESTAQGNAAEGHLSSARDQSPGTLCHVIAYSDPKAERRETAGVLDDYAFTVIACLDAYEATADLSYFRFARAVADSMVKRFYDPDEGGFFDTPVASASSGTGENGQGILPIRRKPFQDSPTPAGNPAAAIGLLRIYAYTNDASYRERAERTLELYAGGAAQHGIFAATFGLAMARLTAPHTQIVIVGNDDAAAELCRAARRSFSLTTAILRIDRNAAIAQNLPPALAETVPNLPALAEARSFAVTCSELGCQPPVFQVEELRQLLRSRIPHAA
jgi:uncharacterized protein YyaL (SSP411 family)